jgi:predicted permease
MLGTLRPSDDFFDDPRAQWLALAGRRKPEFSLREVRQELALLARRADETVPGRRTSVLVTDGSLIQDPEMRARAPWIFAIPLGSTTLLLLLASVNVTTLLLSRSASRQREIAVRLSLGAGRFRLLRQLLTESALLSALAAAFSLLIALRAPAAMWRSLIPVAAPFDITPDWRVLLYCLGIAIAAAVAAGLSPALESVGRHVSEALKGSGTAATVGRRRSRLRSGLVAVQVALSLVLLVQAALFTRAQRRFFSHDPGFETRQVVGVALTSVGTGFDPPAGFYQELESRVNALPGVVRTSYVNPAPWSGRSSAELIEIDGKPVPRTRAPAGRTVAPDYFSALRIPLTRGRAFTREEASSAGPVVPTVISEAMAGRYWPGQDPLGHRFRTGQIHEIIGVCRDLQSVAFMQDDGPFYYSPLDPGRMKPPHLLIRVSGDPQTAAASVREIVRKIDPQMAAGVATLASIVEQQGERLRPVVLYGASAGGLALLLALTGVYGVVSFSVAQRTREIGIRVALGAQRGDVFRLVLRSGAAPVSCGLAAGIGLALLASAAMEGILFGVNPRDPLTLVTVSVLLLAAALAATWIPARRAAALDPLSSLRSE